MKRLISLAAIAASVALISTSGAEAQWRHGWGARPYWGYGYGAPVVRPHRHYGPWAYSYPVRVAREDWNYWPPAPVVHHYWRPWRPVYAAPRPVTNCCNCGCY